MSDDFMFTIPIYLHNRKLYLINEKYLYVFESVRRKVYLAFVPNVSALGRLLVLLELGLRRLLTPEYAFSAHLVSGHKLFTRLFLTLLRNCVLRSERSGTAEIYCRKVLVSTIKLIRFTINFYRERFRRHDFKENRAILEKIEENCVRF